MHAKYYSNENQCVDVGNFFYALIMFLLISINLNMFIIFGLNVILRAE